MRRLTDTPQPGIPFPYSPTPTACRTTPGLFAYDMGDSDQARAEQAKLACATCPIAAACLKWSLANPELTKEGVWAGTIPRQRRTLRRRLADRLGKDWAAVVADHDQRLREQREAARHTPLPVSQACLVRVDHDLNGPTPRHHTITPGKEERSQSRPTAGVA
ncbi:WhiB family transcriptional regulator [Streptomyces sp. NPDC127038]|uniref:WhiB family transcriptional regulator n=1 Tax=Streptomyces sp. NPDC127038 TaxID=3347114 RepID=UPI0036562445